MNQPPKIKDDLLNRKYDRMSRQTKSALINLAENCPPDLIAAPTKKKTGAAIAATPVSGL